MGIKNDEKVYTIANFTDTGEYFRRVWNVYAKCTRYHNIIYHNIEQMLHAYAGAYFTFRIPSFEKVVAIIIFVFISEDVSWKC